MHTAANGGTEPEGAIQTLAIAIRRMMALTQKRGLYNVGE